MTNFLFTSESVAVGHPDKIADQISDAVLDACLAEDLDSRVACEAMVSTGLVFLAGEITTKSHLNFQDIVRKKINEIGYNEPELGFDYRSCGILISINRQSSDISQGVDEGKGLFQEQGAGDQGLMFGYACDDTPELMPLPIALAHKLVRELKTMREKKTLSYLKPDGKTQVTVEYNSDYVPQRIHTVILSAQHADNTSHETITRDMKDLIHQTFPPALIDDKTLIYINPTGRFVIGGPVADCGLTGRKTIVDTYGAMARHGGGAFSGKDPTKVDRSGAYAARYIAKNIVAAKLARRCELQISYAIGISHPISIKVDTFGTGVVSEEALARAIPRVFELSPKGIIKMLDLRRPIYAQTAFGGHFGRDEPTFTWEHTDKIQQLKLEVGSQKSEVRR